MLSLVTGLYESAVAIVTLPADVQRLVRRADALLDDVDRQLAALDGLVEMQRQVTAIANTTGRIMNVIDDVGSRLGSLPGAPLLTRRRTAKPPAT